MKYLLAAIVLLILLAAVPLVGAWAYAEGPAWLRSDGGSPVASPVGGSCFIIGAGLLLLLIGALAKAFAELNRF